MTDDEKREQGSRAWFEMVGQVMSDAARHAALPAETHVSLVERYTDGTDFGDGLVQGFRFDIVAGQPSYRVGAKPDERGDITIEVTGAVARELNAMPADASAQARRRHLETGGIRQQGDVSMLGDWFFEVHRHILARTR